MNTLYQSIESAIRSHVSMTSVPQGTTSEEVYQCVRSLMRKNPDIFWFSHQWKYTEDDLTIYFHYTIHREKSMKAKAQIEDVVLNDFHIREVLKLPIDEQVMYVYKWIALYCKYNIYSAYNQTIYSVFVHRNSACTGYAKAAQYLFEALGIESKLVFGTMHHAEKGSRHCWLIVKINGLWYHFDPTLAVPEISDLLLKEGVIPIFGADGLVYNYFCCDTPTIKQSRLIENEEALPICESRIDFRTLQNLPVRTHRGDGTKKEGVKGCMLSDSGSYASVYLWHSDTNRQSVVKVYKNNTSHELLWHECRIMREMASSSSIIHVLNVTERQDGLIIEQATPLADLLCCHYYQLSATNFCGLLLDVLTGELDCIHHGIYYRDLHLNNIYRTEQGRYVLGDFGSCIWIDRENPSNIGGIGSPWYAAPETYMSGAFDERSVIYEIGMVAYFLLNEFRPPLWAEYEEDSLKNRMDGKELPAPALLKKPSCIFERELASVVNKALSFETKKRYQTLSDLEIAVKHCLSLIKEDYLLIDGGSAERLYTFENKEELGRRCCNIHMDFNSTCENYPEILVSNGEPESILNTDTYSPRIDDFATTASGPSYHKDNTPKTYRPHFEHPQPLLYATPPKASKGSFWSKFLGGKEKEVKKKDDVYSSVFAPSEVKPKSHLMVQVYLHLLEESTEVEHLAVESDKNAERRDYKPLQTKLKAGDVVDVELNIYGESLLSNTSKTICWQGKFTKCSFDYYPVPANLEVEELSCEVNLYVNGALVGDMRFLSNIVEQPRKLNSEITSRTFQRIFISYAHQDAERVRDFALAYKAQGVDYFYDRDKLAAGDVYEEKILEYIDSADLFILCWSANAARSEYVRKERKRAMQHAYPQLGHRDATLKIYPISIEPRTELPKDMAGIYNFEEV